MKIRVKLFSVLRECVENYDPQLGVEVELASHARVDDLIRHLSIPSDKAPVASCDGRILKSNDFLIDGSEINIFQPIAGG
jgi:sulfur carrier protein ThiS